MNFLSVSCGNDSVALVEYFIENHKGEPVCATYQNTGWESDGWRERVLSFKSWCESIEIPFIELKNSIGGMEYWIRRYKNFPQGMAKWCTRQLKIEPLNDYLDEVDPSREGVIWIGVRRCESPKRSQFPERADCQATGREKYAPLVRHTDEMRDALIARAGWEVLPHRSKECAPCIFANKQDLRNLTERERERVRQLEAETGKVMFNPRNKMGAKGIDEVVKWANSERGKYAPDDDCSGGFCGG